jgi:uncharacterized protein (TIGR03066 family)
MAITKFSCPSCGGTFRTAQELPRGKKIKCPKCAEPIALPAPGEDDEEPEEERAPRRSQAIRQRPPERRPPPRDEDEEPDEEVEEEAEERPRERRRKGRKGSKKKQGMSPALFWSLVGGGIALALGGVVVILLVTGVFGSKGGLASEIVGKWEGKGEIGGNGVVEFHKDGKVTISAEGLTLKGTYKVLSKDEIELTVEALGRKVTKKAKVKIDGDTMKVTPSEGGKTETLKRVK